MTEYSVWKQKTLTASDVVLIDDTVNSFLRKIDDTLMAPIVTLRISALPDEADFYVAHIMYKEAKK